MTFAEQIKVTTQSTVRTVKDRPIETILLLILTIVNTFCLNVWEGKLLDSVWLVCPMMLPITLFTNYITPRGHSMRLAYDLMLPVLLLLIVACADERFIELRDTTQYTTIVTLLWLGCLVCQDFKNDNEFIPRLASLGWALLRSALVSTAVTVTLLILNFVSITLFDVNVGWRFMAIPWTLLFPIEFLAFFASSKRVTSITSPIANGLLNFLVSPALMFFLLMLYVYIFKILFSWELPNGGVARMTYVFFIVSIISTSLYRIAMVNVFNRFYYWMPILSLPVIALFWTSVIYRIAQYGLTEMRVWLVMAGILNLVFMLMLVLDRNRCYKMMIVHAIGFLFVLGLVPPLSAKNIAYYFSGDTIDESAEYEKRRAASIAAYKWFKNSEMNLDTDGYSRVIRGYSFVMSDTLCVRDSRDSVVVRISNEKFMRNIARCNGLSLAQLKDSLNRSVLENDCQCVVNLNIPIDTVVVSFGNIYFNGEGLSSTQDVLILAK